jgi:hypothetical protein
MSPATVKQESSDRPNGSRHDAKLLMLKKHLQSIKLEAAKGTRVEAGLIEDLERKIAKLESSLPLERVWSGPS